MKCENRKKLSRKYVGTDTPLKACVVNGVGSLSGAHFYAY